VSSLRTWQACPRKFLYSYGYSIEGKQEPDERLQFGTAVHRALELNVNKPVADWRVGEAVKGLGTNLGAVVAGTVSAYARYWEGSLHYRGAEVRLEAELRNPRLTLLGIVDGIAETPRGDLIFLDHKTSESDIRPGSWFFEKLTLDMQASAYTWLARACGYEVVRGEWDAIKRPKFARRETAIEPEYYVKSGKWGAAGDLKPGTGLPAEEPGEFAKRIQDAILEEPATYFQRAPVVRMDDELEAAMDDIEALGEQVLTAWDKNEWPKNPANCFSYGRRCEFWELCSGAALPNDETLYQIKKRGA
jgi:hypothetical protein